jgi:acyl carrier protein
MPELSEAKFLRDPEGGDKRIYTTGDIGRMRSDGCLFHLGRKDFQVKVRGYRVEIAAIQKALLDLENIKEAVVVDREDSIGEKRLIAYLVCDTHSAPSVSSLRRALLQKLPDYMIPSAFMILDAFPLTPNGKVDRGALPPPNRSRPKLENPYVAPRGPVEEALIEIWAAVLDLDYLGINDNFFELGGHSLLAAQVITRVINTFRVKVPIRSLFQAPTVADMAVVIVQNQLAKADSNDLESLLAEVEALSDEEAGRRFAEQHGNGDNPLSEK